MPFSRRNRLSLALFAACGCFALTASMAMGCRKTQKPLARLKRATSALPVGTATAKRPTRLPRVYDLYANVSRCELNHRGQLIDLGSAAEEGRRAWSILPDPKNKAIEREGATWAQVSRRKVRYLFHLRRPEKLFVSARLRGVASRRATVYIDGRILGALRFSKDGVKIAQTITSKKIISEGMHVVMLRFHGRRADDQVPFANLDWLRIGLPDERRATYAAPTLRDIQHHAALRKVPHRALALRSPSNLRCSLGVAPGGELRTAIGLQGPGKGAVEVRISQAGQAPQVLKRVVVTGGDQASWTDVRLSLKEYVGQIVTVEFAVTKARRGARLLLGDPVITAGDRKVRKVPKARAVIVVVLSSTDAGRLPPKVEPGVLPGFDTLVREGVSFEAHRQPSTVVASTMASMLTGLSPRQHGLEDAYARLPDGVSTLATFAKDASVRTFMSTSNPATFEPFGFRPGWDHFEAHSPVSPARGTVGMEEIADWIRKQVKLTSAPLFALVHARGLHPPFDLTPGEFSQLPPNDYTGVLDARRAGELLAKARSSRRRRARLSQADYTRLAALLDSALVQTDGALANLIKNLKQAKLWDKTLLVVTSDISNARDNSELPFHEFLPLREDYLYTPLFVHFPHNQLAGGKVKTPSTAVDIARTAMTSLGVHAPDALGGMDLFDMASRDAVPVERMLSASLSNRYAARWGDLRLEGKLRSRKRPKLCNVPADPTCEVDIFDAMPLAGLTLWRWVYDHEALAFKGQRKRPKRSAATLDQDTAAAIGVWGRLED